MIWFSSDWHLGHTNILKYDKRPYKTIQEHDEAILRTFEQTVKYGDEFWFLGDFAFAQRKRIFDIFDRMHDKIGYKAMHFIKGNHDKSDTIDAYKEFGTYYGEKHRLKYNENGMNLEHPMTLDHFPCRTWDRSHKGAWHLYGHHHGLIEVSPHGRSMDVGLPAHGYNLVPFTKVREILSKRDIWYPKGDAHKSGRE